MNGWDRFLSIRTLLDVGHDEIMTPPRPIREPFFPKPPSSSFKHFV
jgi:hypothetical protein